MCFTLLWFRDLLIWLVVMVAVVALLRLLLPWLLRQLGTDVGVLMRAIDIFVWAIVAIFVIYVIFALISCLAGGGGALPLFPRAK
jgi:H+/Cl- antiporter ClcA